MAKWLRSKSAGKMTQEDLSGATQEVQMAMASVLSHGSSVEPAFKEGKDPKLPLNEKQSEDAWPRGCAAHLLLKDSMRFFASFFIAVERCAL